MASLKTLLKHIDKCPFAWSSGLYEGKILVHRDTSQEEILLWLEKLVQLKDCIKEQESKADTPSHTKKGLTRTL